MSADKASTTLDALSEQFISLYGLTPQFVQAPGRVNLIGEHTDYNDGFVLPAAIQFHTTVAITPRPDHRLFVFSQNYDEQMEFDANQLPSVPRHHWSDYVLGVARKLSELDIRVPGANLLIHGDVPQGAGLSSSASLEVAVCQAFLQVAGRKLNGVEMALLCQRAENEFVGARCGIMDQFVSVHGQKDHALLLDCRSLTFTPEPIPAEVRLVICNTMVRHSVAGGEYNQRRRECELGAKYFAGLLPGVKALRDVSLAQFAQYGAGLPETIRKRCRHVITENARVAAAAAALKQHDLSHFGQLLRESHASLRDDFQVSCSELDLMVELAGKVDGVFGARMTGGGFGGCTINFVRSGDVDAFQSTVARGYEAATKQRPEIYVCTAGNGVQRLD
ncbi:MAG TPA: galactokinase [Candidatus Sulfotelmatobacter sp.]|nr:galactokinase [Candidatus Sulfotelmatobacter sp.]